MAYWVSPTAPTPMILPAINSWAETLATTTSTMRDDFSSSTPRITCMP